MITPAQSSFRSSSLTLSRQGSMAGRVRLSIGLRKAIYWSLVGSCVSVPTRARALAASRRLLPKAAWLPARIAAEHKCVHLELLGSASERDHSLAEVRCFEQLLSCNWCRRT
jgi:hypothetical protein